MPNLHVLSAGAAQSLIESLRGPFEAGEGVTLRTSFHPVGATMEKLLAGEPCDVVVLTATLLDELARGGDVRTESIAPLGSVHTSIAVREGDEAPDVTTAAALREVFIAADAIFLPDIHRSTAGGHCVAMLRKMGILDRTNAKLRACPDGISAMRELAQSRAVQPVGCTQVTEIAATAGVVPVGPLPGDFALATLYSVAVTERAQQSDAAIRLASLLAGPTTRELRRRCGFDTAG
jgi:molybdate transport system substrate-binding protein